MKLYAAFLDFMGAFDRVPRALVWDKLCSKFGVKGKLLRVIVDLFTDTNARAMVNGYLTRNFPIESGVLQGSVLGPTLFLLFIDDLLDELQTSTLGIPMLDFVLSVLAFADDVTLLSLAKKNLQEHFNICGRWAKRNGMLFGLDKCFVLVFNSKSKKPQELPSFYLPGIDNKPHPLPSFFPDKNDELYLGYNPTDLITRTKIDESSVRPLSQMPNFRKKPHPQNISNE